VKLACLTDFINLSRANKQYRNMSLDKRLPITVNREDIVGSMLRAFGNIKGPSLFRQMDVRFVGESGIDRGGLTTEALADFFAALLPDSRHASVSRLHEHAAVATALREDKDKDKGVAGNGSSSEDDASPKPVPAMAQVVPHAYELFESSGSYWLPRKHLHGERARRLEQLAAVGKVLAKCLMELHAVPNLFPPLLFAALAYGGSDEAMPREILQSHVRLDGEEKMGDDEHLARQMIESLWQFDPEMGQSMINLLEHDQDGCGMCVGDVLNETPFHWPTPEAMSARLEAAFAMDAPDDSSDEEVEKTKADDDAHEVDDEGGGKRRKRPSKATSSSKLGDELKGDGARWDSQGECVHAEVAEALAISGGPSMAAEAAAAAAAAADERATAIDNESALLEPLSNANKAVVVSRVIASHLIEERLPEIVALRRGFHTIRWRSHVALFTGRELHELVCGVPSLDAAELFESFAFDERSKEHTRGWMHDILHQQDETWRKRLLRFVTGSYTLPYGGLARRVMVRAQGEAHANLLPRASTCTNTLFLPPYPSKAVLTSKLTTAIDNTAGFWIW